MAEPPALLRPGKRHSAIFNHSPTRHRAADDILAHIAPSNAVDALASPLGALKDCLDAASAAERDFAMRTAIASQRIWEWVDELSEWDWPTDGGSAGFEEANRRQGQLPISSTTSVEPARDGFLGSLSAADVAAYEQRIEGIHVAMEDLELEDIKSHVLNNHIMPLSRPNSPMKEAARQSIMSTYNKMEDMTAVITAIVVQTLPNLAKLSRLLQTWTVRLRVLRRVPSLALAIDDAEVALRSGWAAITQATKRLSQVTGSEETLVSPTLKRQDFEVMNKVLTEKVTKPGQMLDYMLDCLEGTQDTLPDLWLDRMESVELRYSEWVAACERKIREADWNEIASARGHAATQLPPPGTTSSRDSDAVSLTADSSTAFDEATDDQSTNDNATSSRQPGPPSVVVQDEAGTTSNMDRDFVPADDTDQTLGLDRSMLPVEEEDELELPPLRSKPSDASLISQTSMTMHGVSSQFDVLSSDPPEVGGSPVVPRTRIREATYPDDSPPSSPPLPRDDTTDDRPEASTTLLDSPFIAPIDGESIFLKGPADESFVDDFDDTLSMSELTSSMLRRESTGDQQLRQQISEIIESIPAKIRLSAEPPAINLNPPDLQLPRLRKRPSKEPFRRSPSAMSVLSSRAATPSFTLSPAKNSRPRHRGQQEIKVYHLSRSTGEPPIKLFIRCVGEHGERVMVRVGGGWADLSEYLKAYATHHGRRSAGLEKAKIEVRDVPRTSSGLVSSLGSSPPRPRSTAPDSSPVTPLTMHKTRRPAGSTNNEAQRLRPKTPADASRSVDNAPSSEESVRSRTSSRFSWADDDSSFLGLAGPTGKKVEMSDESRAWVESIKEKVRLASGEIRASAADDKNRFGELGKVGGTKRLFRKTDERNWR
ncbi:GAS2 domain-containing protein [Purpureocillium lavendulum]|uniref:GAS2 domain-containing protein n=1 Tax=Purpureocillium lavendulum TaxID=1247861 RepID=A0AB34FH44_9HYPO|nr:GAS2 domain-containing protein [Purpureocillium lavendulum]